MRVALLCAAVLASGCAPSPDDLKARLGGLDDGEVAGVTRDGDVYIITGRCLEHGRGQGFDVRVAVGDLDQRSNVDGLVARVRSAIQLACLQRGLGR